MLIILCRNMLTDSLTEVIPRFIDPSLFMKGNQVLKCGIMAAEGAAPDLDHNFFQSYVPTHTKYRERLYLLL